MHLKFFLFPLKIKDSKLENHRNLINVGRKPIHFLQEWLMPLRKISHLEFIQLFSCILFLFLSLLPSLVSFHFTRGHLHENSISTTWGFICCFLFSFRIHNPLISPLSLHTPSVWGMPSGKMLHVTTTNEHPGGLNVMGVSWHQQEGLLLVKCWVKGQGHDGGLSRYLSWGH